MKGVIILFLVQTCLSDISLELFSHPTHSWRAHNDPVMGGKSTGNFTIQGGIGLFQGRVVDVPFLRAPGFITMQSHDDDDVRFSDVSACSALEFTARTKSAYSGYRISFGTKQPPVHKVHAYGYKAHFDVPVGGEFITVKVPFTNFSDYWDDATGKLIKTCQDDPIYCPDQDTLKNMKTISIWAEGVAGTIHFEIKSIMASGCKQKQKQKQSESALESFSNPAHTWRQVNDPVMGGKSTGTFTIKSGVGIFDGEVVDVPSLKAPGFIKVDSTDGHPFPDVRSCNALALTFRANISYSGYRISFGTKRPPVHKYFAYGFKSHFDAPMGTDFTTIAIPFVNFSDYWDDATGKQIKTCQEDKIYCPDDATLKNMKTISIWAEGVAGYVHLEVKSIEATGCSVGELDPNPRTWGKQTEGDDDDLESFSSPSHTWRQVNDPVMGGKSTGTFTIKSGLGIFDGDVVDVPSLKAPGFIKVDSTDRTPFPDVRSCNALALIARTNNSYAGYRISFGTKQSPIHKFFAYGFKAHFDAPVGKDFMTIEIPFVNFSDYWDDATGEQIKTCQDDKIYCPDDATLKNMKTISIWAEGVAGSVHLEVKGIKAIGCTGLGEDSKNLLRMSTNHSNNNNKKRRMNFFVPDYNSSCSLPIEAGLRYNLSNTAAVEDFPFPLPTGETLVDAVCCDPGFKSYAEPKGLYVRHDVDLFGKLNAHGTTTFYDSACGIPLFVAPRGRSFADFKADTEEHGWPSFRKKERVVGNSRVIKETGEVLSKCGTHLGSFLPDDKGERWCLDLACISGNPKSVHIG